MNDQGVTYPYIVYERPKERKFFVQGWKVSTNGRVTVASFEYRAGFDEPLYLPQRQQAEVYAHLLCNYLNSAHVTVKDERNMKPKPIRRRRDED